jgi:hypothetical protein
MRPLDPSVLRHLLKVDSDARRAYNAIRARGASRKEAESEIELAFQGCFREYILSGRDRRLEAWISLAEGLPAARLFPDIPGTRSSSPEDRASKVAGEGVYSLPIFDNCRRWVIKRRRR